MEILLSVLIVLVLLSLALLILVWRQDRAAPLQSALREGVAPLRADIERMERGLRDDLRDARTETQATLAAFDARLGQFTERTENGLGALRQNLGSDALSARQESAEGLKNLAESLHRKLEKLNETTERRLGEVRATLEKQLKEIQADNAGKLEQMRQTVDEKLHATLETRLGESFKLVSERLEQVHRGLGEMQSLATGVGDLKRVLTNVKTRGIWGEVQLSGLIEDMLTREQYEVNVATRPGSTERVEFAIRLPGQSADGTPVWLPIDAKFPREDYERLLDAQDRADVEGAAAASVALERRIREEAKTISLKYVEPPHTTNFAILFLPTEGLYAEVARRPGLSESLQRDYRVTVAGPTNLCMLLNSLQMGFRTLAIEKRSSEVWHVLGAVRTEFGRFATVLEKTKKQLKTVTNSIDEAGVSTRQIERKLKDVEKISSGDAQTLLGDALDFSEPDDTNENGAE